MSERLIMNKELGTKWFTFYTRVRPWFAAIAALASIVNFAQYPSVFLNNIGLLIAFGATIAQTVLSIIVAVKADGDYEDFVYFVKEVLVFETINMAYQSASQQYYQNGYNIATAAIMGGILLIFSYFVWYRPNVKYFRRRLIQAPKSTQTTNAPIKAVHETKSSEQPIHICLSEEGVPSQTYGNYHVRGSDIMLVRDNESPKVSSTSKTVVQPKKVVPPTEVRASRYCSRCGNAIDPTTKKCIGCGKQYFKGFSWKTFLVILEVLFVISFAANIVLFFSSAEMQNDIADLERENSVLVAENQQLEDDVASLKKSKDTFYSFYERNHDKLELLDSWVVFVENDGSRLYHKYECNKFVGDDCWAHNIEYAEYLGYKPCPQCFK